MKWNGFGGQNFWFYFSKGFNCNSLSGESNYVRNRLYMCIATVLFTSILNQIMQYYLHPWILCPVVTVHGNLSFKNNREHMCYGLQIAKVFTEAN